mgnify:FL=1
MSYQTLFLQQSYRDCTKQYEEILHNPNLPLWDYVVLTASNEAQAQAYRAQISYRLKHQMLPEKTHYAVLPDPDGKRVGSGGATLNVLRYIREHAAGKQSPAAVPHGAVQGDGAAESRQLASAQPGEAACHAFDGKRILVIHSGGDSKRVPQYSACGKLFSPVPRILPNGRRSTLFDEFMIAMCGVAARMNAGMLVCSGDVLLLFNPLQIDFYGKGAAALSIKEPAEIGKNHGVYRRDREGNVGGFLHKKTVEQLHEMGAVDEHGHVDIDTGAVMMSVDLLNSLYSLIDTEEKFAACVNEQARLSFYADFLYPLASDSTLEQYYQETPEGEFTPELRACREKIWAALHPYQMKLIRMSPAAFIHFGTTRELLHLMTEGMEQFTHLGWQARINTNSQEKSYGAGNSYISLRADVGAGSYIEDSYLHHGTVVGERCVISGVTLDGQSVPADTVLHGLKLQDGRFVVRMYGVCDNPKEAALFGKKIGEPLWTAAVYPIRNTIQEAVSATLRAYEDGFPTLEDGISLKDSFNQADVTAILPWQDKLEDKVKIESLLEAIDKKDNLHEAVKVFNGEINARVIRQLCGLAEKLDEQELFEFSRKIRIYYALSCLTKQDKYLDLCLDTIRNAILVGAVAGLSYDPTAKMEQEEVVVRLPVRVNWGGGWSDTPPYCMEHGGTVLNAAVKLDGQNPVEAVVKKIPGNQIVLASADSGAEQTFSEISQLQDSSNPYDPFALHKAALIACGIIPYREQISVEEVTKNLGSGLYLSTQVIHIPRGSGLGTSSILAGACVKAIYRMLGKELSQEELYNRVLCMEQIMSTGGGWQDQVGGLAPGIKMVTSDVAIVQEIGCSPCNISTETLQELNERFCLIYSGQRRLARNLLRDIVSRYVSGNPDTVEVLYEIQRIAVLMRFELEKGNVDGFAQLLNQHWELSKRLDGGCTNTCIDMIFSSVEDLIDGKMICGAGGGGFLQVILKKGVTAEQVQKRLREVFQDSGVEVWRCSLVG